MNLGFMSEDLIDDCTNVACDLFLTLNRDKVLIRALYFAERQHGFEKMMKSFGAEDNTAFNLAYGYCKLLLELGHENALALDTAFSVL